MESENGNNFYKPYYQGLKRLSIQLVAPPLLNYRNSIELPAAPIPIDPKDRKRSFGGPGGLPGGPRSGHDTWTEKPDPKAPKDRFNIVMITLFILGFTGLLPMTMFITANEYWMYKFRDVNIPWANYSENNRTDLQVNYAVYSQHLNSKFMFCATLLKVAVFTPLVYMSNAKPRRHLSVWLKHDWEYMAMMFLNTMCMGFLINLSMFWTTVLVPPEQMEVGFRVIIMCLGAVGSLSSPLNVVAVNIL